MQSFQPLLTSTRKLRPAVVVCTMAAMGPGRDSSYRNGANPSRGEQYRPQLPAQNLTHLK